MWGVSVDISRLNPHLSNWRTDITIYDCLYDTLTRRGSDMKLIPSLATEWTSLNEKTWQFKLRPGVKFHNGAPLTAADVKFSIERSYDPAAKTLVATVFSGIDKIEVVNDLTVDFVMKEPDPLFPARHAWNGGHILPAGYFQDVGADAFEKSPIGTGPFKFVEWVKDDRLVLEANAEHWGGPPNVGRLVVRPKPDPAARTAAMLAGDLHFIDEIPADQIQHIERSSAHKVVDATIAGLNQASLHHSIPPLGNTLVRQALSLAIDRQAMVRDLLLGKAIVASGWIPKGDFAFDPSLPPLPYDREKAKSLLVQAAYKGETIVYEVLQNEQPLAEAIVAMWKEIGVDGKIEVLENSIRAQKLRDRSWKGAYSSFSASPLGDPDGLMWRNYGPNASSRYLEDPEWDRLGQEAHTSLDQDKRLKNYQRMNQIFLEQMPSIPLFQPLRSYGMLKEAQWKGSGSGVLDFRRDNLTFTG